MAKIKATTNKEMKLALINLLSDPKVKIESWSVKKGIKKTEPYTDDNVWSIYELTRKNVITIEYYKKKINT